MYVVFCLNYELHSFNFNVGSIYIHSWIANYNRLILQTYIHTNVIYIHLPVYIIQGDHASECHSVVCVHSCGCFCSYGLFILRASPNPHPPIHRIVDYVQRKIYAISIWPRDPREDVYVLWSHVNIGHRCRNAGNRILWFHWNRNDCWWCDVQCLFEGWIV